ncbi:hypothetical protein QOT17_020614 [Balamuthia mandrillaris]
MKQGVGLLVVVVTLLLVGATIAEDVTNRIFWQTRRMGYPTIGVSSSHYNGSDIQTHFQFDYSYSDIMMVVPMGVDREGNVYLALYNQSSSSTDVVSFDLNGNKKGAVASGLGYVGDMQVRGEHLLMVIRDFVTQNSSDEVCVVAAPINSFAPKKVFCVASSLLGRLPTGFDICHSVDSFNERRCLVAISSASAIVVGNAATGTIEKVHKFELNRAEGAGVSIHNNDIFYNYYSSYALGSTVLAQMGAPDPYCEVPLGNLEPWDTLRLDHRANRLFFGSGNQIFKYKPRGHHCIPVAEVRGEVAALAIAE